MKKLICSNCGRRGDSEDCVDKIFCNACGVEMKVEEVEEGDA